jgi:hypothetical protein
MAVKVVVEPGPPVVGLALAEPPVPADAVIVKLPLKFAVTVAFVPANMNVVGLALDDENQPPS